MNEGIKQTSISFELSRNGIQLLQNSYLNITNSPIIIPNGKIHFFT